MKILLLIVGIMCVLLGGLWLLQGLGWVTIPPILCVAECEALEGPSPGWAITGAVVAAVGVAALVFSRRWRSRR